MCERIDPDQFGSPSEKSGVIKLNKKIMLISPSFFRNSIVDSPEQKWLDQKATNPSWLIFNQTAREARADMFLLNLPVTNSPPSAGHHHHFIKVNLSVRLEFSVDYRLAPLWGGIIREGWVPPWQMRSQTPSARCGRGSERFLVARARFGSGFGSLEGRKTCRWMMTSFKERVK